MLSCSTDVWLSAIVSSLFVNSSTIKSLSISQIFLPVSEEFFYYHKGKMYSYSLCDILVYGLVIIIEHFNCHKQDAEPSLSSSVSFDCDTIVLVPKRLILTRPTQLDWRPLSDYHFSELQRLAPTTWSFFFSMGFSTFRPVKRNWSLTRRSTWQNLTPTRPRHNADEGRFYSDKTRFPPTASIVYIQNWISQLPYPWPNRATNASDFCTSFFSHHLGALQSLNWNPLQRQLHHY